MVGYLYNLLPPEKSKVQYNNNFHYYLYVENNLIFQIGISLSFGLKWYSQRNTIMALKGSCNIKKQRKNEHR